MAVNPLFGSARGERVEWDLKEDLIIESIQYSGTDVLYVPKQWTVTDDVLAEITSSKFGHAYEIEVTVEGLENMVKNAYMLSSLNLGFQLSNVTITMAKRRFRECVPEDATHIPGRPNEGDLIYIPHTQTLLEIKSADPDNLIQSGGRLHVYKLQCEMYRSDHTKIPTGPDGITDIDQMPEILLDGQLDIDDSGEVIISDSSKTAENAAIVAEDGIIPERR